MQIQYMKAGVVLSAVLALSACTTTPDQKPPVQKGPFFSPAAWSELPESADSDWQNALSAFRKSCAVRTFSTKEVWKDACRMAEAADPTQARSFFMDRFSAWRVLMNIDPQSPSNSGLMTGYYEPQLTGSRTRQGPFQNPILGAPDDLLIIDLAEVYPSLEGMRLRGKLDGRRVVPYDKRGVIQDREELEKYAIAWVDNPVSAFFLHIQGSGRILLPDGTYMRVGYADRNGWKYKSIGRWLVANGDLKPHQLSMQNIKAWAAANPDKVKEMMAQNPSYIFFEERTGDSALGPIGAQGVPITPLASVAVDPAYWKLGTPFFVNVHQERPDLEFARPVVAQDTGGAIKGAIRFDYFWGFGDAAGQNAGRQKSKVEAWMLVPNGFEPEDAMR